MEGDTRICRQGGVGKDQRESYSRVYSGKKHGYHYYSGKNMAIIIYQEKNMAIIIYQENYLYPAPLLLRGGAGHRVALLEYSGAVI
jgi:hypothetical protein